MTAGDPASSSSSAASSSSPFSFPAFRWYALSLVAATVAMQIRSTVVAWQVYELTGSVLALGCIGIAEIVPFFICILPGGAAADRYDRRRIMGAALLLHLLCAGGLAALALVPASPTSPHLVWGILAAVAGGGCARAFLMPARTALSAEVAPPALAEQIARWRTGLFQLALVAGPALGGLLYAAGGAVAAYAVDAALIVTAMAALSGMGAARAAPLIRHAADDHRIGEGIRFLLRERVLLGASALDLFAVLFGGAVAMLPAFAKEILAVGPQGLGALRAAPAVGAAAIALVLAWRSPFERAGMSMLGAVLGFGLCMMGFGLSSCFLLSLLLLAISGACDQISVTVRQTLLQVRTPPRLLGRVSAVNAIFIGSSNEIGALESGIAARVLGLVPSVVWGGGVTIAVVVLAAVGIPELRRLRRITPP